MDQQQMPMIPPMPQMPRMPMMPGPCPGAIMGPEYYLRQVCPLVRYGLFEARRTGVRHAMTEVALVSYLMGMGYDCQTAYRMVESWEVDERFPMEC